MITKLLLRISIALLSILYQLTDITCLGSEESPQPPHIILIYADDLGWNGVSFNGAPQIPTPNIDALALNGVVLHNYYGEWLCTPSRGALLSGKLPIRLGLQHLVIKAGEASALPLNVTTLPEHLEKLNYKTHMVGKWHLGCHTKEYTPIYRGFDSFFGYYNGMIDYYDYTYNGPTNIPNQPMFTGLDIHNGTTNVEGMQGRFATHAFTEAAENIILNHDPSKPLFLYLAELAVHAGNMFRTPNLQAPADVISKFEYIKDINRRIHAAIVSGLDESVGNVFKALHEKNMLENSIFVLISDNGGEVNPKKGGYGSNFPLRGNKYTFWEGGIHVPAVVWSPLLKLDEPRISKQLMHVTDWLPTLYKAAGGDPVDLGFIDGIDMWQTLLDDSPSPRTHLLQNLDPIFGTSAFRLLDLKVVNGTTPDGLNHWYGPTGFENFDHPANYEWVFKEGSLVKDILQEMRMWIVKDPNDIYQRLRITCECPPPRTAYTCQPDKKPCLFNITADPCEYTNLADQNPEIVKKMMDIIYEYKAESAMPQSKPSDRRADPLCHNYKFVPWLDPEHYNECDYASGSEITYKEPITLH